MYHFTILETGSSRSWCKVPRAIVPLQGLRGCPIRPLLVWVVTWFVTAVLYSPQRALPLYLCIHISPFCPFPIELHLKITNYINNNPISNKVTLWVIGDKDKTFRYEFQPHSLYRVTMGTFSLGFLFCFFFLTFLTSTLGDSYGLWTLRNKV